ncbi:hypothetical protein [Desertivirga brevis]|uniref:hypothetical protein n=1 Tax=Desertivirga brevis TaxID=2810310 RepID=UPI001A9687AE|nr:hypothetical protein [Pedobacter sp. SYSU D00873]
MIEFLKESTFAVNDVLQVAWKVLKKEYFKILGLCLLMFFIFNLSGMLAYFFDGFNFGIKIILFLFFTLAYFGFQLTLFRFILRVLDEDRDDVFVKHSFPTTKQIVKFLLATAYFALCIFIVFMLVMVIFFPLYIVVGANARELVLQVGYSIAVLFIIFTWIRISFFPFFIIDKDVSPFKSIRFSLAITRGNFTKILLLLSFLAIFQILSIFFANSDGDFIIAGAINLLNSLLIIPLSSVTLAVAYRRMMNEYEGDQDPEILDNII